VPPDGRSASLHSFNMNANWFQKERLNYGRKLNTPWYETFRLLKETPI